MNLDDNMYDTHFLVTCKYRETMKRNIIRILLGSFAFFVLLLGCLAIIRHYKRVPPQSGSTVYRLAREKANALKTYAVKNGYDTCYCFLVDYSLPSGTPRFFIWNFMTEEIEFADFCMHGAGKGNTACTPIFSNQQGSNCSSLGRFIVLKNKYGKILGEKRSRGVIGIDSSNNNAQQRGLLIHDSYFLDYQSFIPRKCLPLNGASCSGCITITSNGFKKAKEIIDHSSAKILLWTYCSQSPH